VHTQPQHAGHIGYSVIYIFNQVYSWSFDIHLFKYDQVYSWSFDIHLFKYASGVVISSCYTLAIYKMNVEFYKLNYKLNYLQMYRYFLNIMAGALPLN
jgi:hypothetical protein